MWGWVEHDSHTISVLASISPSIPQQKYVEWSQKTWEDLRGWAGSWLCLQPWPVEREDLSVGAEERGPSAGWRKDARLSLPALSPRPQVGSWHNLHCFFREYRPLLWLSRGLRKQVTSDSSVLNSGTSVAIPSDLVCSLQKIHNAYCSFMFLFMVYLVKPFSLILIHWSLLYFLLLVFS